MSPVLISMQHGAYIPVRGIGARRLQLGSGSVNCGACIRIPLAVCIRDPLLDLVRDHITSGACGCTPVVLMHDLESYVPYTGIRHVPRC